MDNPPPPPPPPPDQNPNSPQFLKIHQNPNPFDQDSPNPFPDSPLSSPSPLFRLPSFPKRKKGKPNIKKLQAIFKKCQILKENLRPLPFLPSKILFFAKFEKLLRRLGLWDFVHVQFDRVLRVDLLAQLVGSYDSKARCSFVNGVRILVNRADLGRAFKLPLKKEKVNVVEDELELLNEESIGFLVDFVENWLVLHDEGWVMPGEVLNWMKVIKEGHLEKVDWAGLFWFMVEKELTQGDQLVDCYYAPHLQYLMMYQAEEMVLASEADKVELDGEEKEVVVGVANEGCLQVDCANEVQKGEVELAGEESKGEVGEGSLGVDSMTGVQKEGVDVGVEFEMVELAGEESKEEVGEGTLGVDFITYVQEESVNVGVESELADLAGKESKAEVGEGTLGVVSITYVEKEGVDVGVESEMVEVAGKESKEEVGEGTLGVDSITYVQEESVDVGVESELVELAGEERKEKVGVGTLIVDSITYVQKESVDVGVEVELVDLAGEERKGEVGEGSLGVHSITDVQNEEVDDGVESKLVELATEQSKGEVGESLGVDSETDIPKVEHDVGVESELVNLAGEESKGEVGEGSFGVDSITGVREEEVYVPERLNIELTLGKDTGAEEEIVEEEEKVCDAEMMDLEEGNERVGDDKLVQWPLDAETTVVEPTLQRCNMERGNVFYNYGGIGEEVEDIEEDGEEEDPFDSLENHNTLVGDGLTGNFLQAMQANKLAFSSHEQFHDQPDIGLVSSRNDMQHTNSTGPSYYNSGSKRVIEHMSENSLNDNGKRLRIDGPWNNESPNFVTCMDGMQQVIRRARMMYEAKEQSLAQSNMSEQILLSEMQKRDSVIEHLKCKCKEMQEKDEEIYRLDREVQVMGNLLNGYREALKETQKAFAEYQQHNPLPEELIYKDAGPGGLMLSQKEVYRTNCLMLEQKAKEAEEGYAHQFEAFFEKVGKLDSRLVGLENEMMELKNSSRNHKGSEIEHPISRKTSLPDGYEGIENERLEEPVSREMLEQPVSSMNDMLDNCEGTQNEHPVFRETSTPDDQQGAEMEQN